MLLTLIVLCRIITNPVSNAFQKLLTLRRADPLFVIFATHAGVIDMLAQRRGKRGSPLPLVSAVCDLELLKTALPYDALRFIFSARLSAISPESVRPARLA